MTEPHKLAIVGGGAAGLMAALWAARALGESVVLLESSNKCGAKIVAAGGGRCNVLPEEVEVGDFYTQGSTNVLKRLLKTWRVADLKNFFAWDLQLPLAEAEADGRIFPECQSGRTVRDQLVSACEQAGVVFNYNWRVDTISKDGDSSFVISDGDGR